MINDDGSDNSGSVVVTDEREHNMINGDGSDKSGRENICGIFVAEDNSSTGSDESDSSRTENIGGVCSIAEDFSSTGSSIGIQYVDQVPHDIASFEAVIRNSVCLVVGGLKVEVHAIHQDQVMMISTAFLITLCVVHNFGTSKVGIAIDPALDPAFFIWFCPLGGIGIYNIVQNDSSVLRAFNHVHIYSFFKRNSTTALHSLESCLLCATGSEAMYTDLCYFVVQFVRYLEKAVFNLDYGQLKLVFHALEERKQVIDNAPHLCHALCMTPCFGWFDVVYYWAGLKMYDLVAGFRLLHVSRYYSAQESVELFPTLLRNGKDKSLKGTVVYYDGQMNDSRLNVGLACTAAIAGAAVLNHAEVIGFLKDKKSNRTIGARIRDNLTGEEFETYAKVVVNAAGPFCDSVRKLTDKDVKPMICPSSGVHIILPDYYSPEGMGLIVPKTKDGRVVFMLPWLGRTVAGTTDSNTEITLLPEPHEDEIQFILDAISDYLNVKVRRTDVLSAWSGIRPLATDPSAKNTESISRDHVVCEDYPGLVTITGGKWTTYRGMAEDAVNAAIKSGKLTPQSGCVTSNLPIVGGDGWDPASFTVIAQQYTRMKKSHGKVVPGVMDTAAAKHLSHAYGTFAERVAAIAQNENLGKRLAHGYPYLEAEVAYCARNEYCESAIDFIARRSRLAFLDTDAAGRALPRVIEILATEHNWDNSRQKQELEAARKFLETFKSSKNAQFHDGKHNG